MEIYENIYSVLQNLSDLQERYTFIDENDIAFLNDYFTRNQHLFALKETLNDPDACIYEDRIESELLESVTNSVRRVSKKSRDAAKLSHIVKKNHFKAFFQCMKELSNEEHIPLEYVGPLEEIIIEEDLYDGNESESHSVTSENSYESEGIEDNSAEISNLPPYQTFERKNIPQIRLTNNSSILSPNHNGRFGDNKGYSIDSDFQIISIQRDGRPLGITVVKSSVFHAGKQVNGCSIERILVNSLIDKQGLLQVGDIILEVNDEPVETTEDIRDLLERHNGTLTFKTIKSQKRPASNFVNREKVFVRALFDFNPHEYSLLPAEEIGLPFKAGDVFEVLNRDDDNFWQALPLNSTDNQAYLIPSQSLQERLITATKALNAKQDESTSGKGKRKKSKKVEIFRAKDAADLGSEVDLQTYEDVVRFGPSRVPLLILIGPTGIGKKAIKHLLVTMEPHRFSFPIMDTSLAKKSRNQPLMNHIDRAAMLSDINLSRYVCVEEKSGELFGIKLSLIKDLIKQGKTVVLDCQPKDVYSLKIPIFNPYVILIAAPQLYLLEAMQKDGLEKNLTKNKRSTSELQNIIDQSDCFREIYKHLINKIIVNGNVHETASNISTILSEFENNPSWIPASWELDITPLAISKPAPNKRNLKLNDNANAPSSLPRRYEKRNEKPSVSSNSNKVALNNSLENSYSEQESETDSENNVVKAKPVKYSNSKKSDDNVIKVEEKPVKHSNSKKNEDPKLKVEEKSPKNSVSKVPEDKTDGKSKKTSISRKPESTKLQADEKPIKPTITKKPEEKTPKIEEPQIKHKPSKKTEENPRTGKDKPIETSPVNVHVNKKSSLTVSGQKPNQMQNRNTKEPENIVKPRIDVPGANNKNKTLEIKHEESIRTNTKSMPPQKAAAAGRLNIIRKENSSSEISDTSSDSDAVMIENRV